MRSIPVLVTALAVGTAACSTGTNSGTAYGTQATNAPPPAATAQAAPATGSTAGVKLGVLSCGLSGRTNAIVYTKETLDCTFNPANGQPVPYQGHVQNIGLDLQHKSSEQLVWAVLAPTTSMNPGALAGTYRGVSGSAAVGVGAGANVLVGGFDSSITLQPLSVSGSTGIGAAAGVESLTLTQGQFLAQGQ